MTRLRAQIGRAPSVAVARLWLYLCLGAVGLWPEPASACKPILPDFVSVERPKWPEGAAIELVEERVEIECTRERPVTKCHWRVVYVYESQVGGALDGELVVDGQAQLDDLRVRVNGRERDGAVHPISPTSSKAEAIHEPIHVEDATRVEIEVDVDVSFETEDRNGCALPAGAARHQVVSVDPQVAGFEIRDAWRMERPRPPTQLRVRAPKGWRVSVRDGPRTRGRDLDVSVDGGALEAIDLENRPVYHGPFAAAGVGFGPQIRPRLRAGWEVSAPGFMLYSAAVEGDVVEELMVVPAIEVASPTALMVIPSAGIGIGAPVMVLPELRPGFRVQASLSWVYVGLIGSFDVYPTYDGLGQALRGALMIQVSI